MSDNNIKLQLAKLPRHIPAIMDSGVSLLPGEEVTFKIRGIAFKNTIDFSFKNSARFVSVYSANHSQSEDVNIATIGKIIKFSETKDRNYIIVIKGLIRFNIIKAIKIGKTITILMPDYSNFTNDLFIKKAIFKDRASLNRVVEEYFSKTDNTILDNINLEAITDIKLLSLLSNQLNFNKFKKRKLLTASNAEEINDFIFNLLEYELAIVESRLEAKH